MGHKCWLTSRSLLLLCLVVITAVGCVRGKPPITRTLTADDYPRGSGSVARPAATPSTPVQMAPTVPYPVASVTGTAQVVTATAFACTATVSPTASPSVTPSPSASSVMTATIEVPTATMTPVVTVTMTLSPTLASPTPSPTWTCTATPPEQRDVTHTVVVGDTLNGIAARYGSSVSAILAKNGLTNPNWIYVGQELVVPIGYEPQEIATPKLVQHQVQMGETLSQIARRYRSSVSGILANSPGVSDPDHVSPGTLLTIPTYTQTPQMSHTVRYGETASSIARRYGVRLDSLIMANGLRDPNHVYTGQVLVIPR